MAIDNLMAIYGIVIFGTNNTMTIYGMNNGNL